MNSQMNMIFKKILFFSLLFFSTIDLYSQVPIDTIKKTERVVVKMNNGDESWYSLLRHLKRWAKNSQLSFELNYDRANKLKYDMAKRDHMKRKEKVAKRKSCSKEGS
jgi:hypothetical protein